MARTRTALIVLALTASLASLAHAGGKYKHDPSLWLRPNEFGLNFAAGRASDRIYAGLLAPDVKDARVQVGARIASDLWGACVEGRRPDSYGVFSIRRIIPLEPLEENGAELEESDAGDVQAEGGGFGRNRLTSQILIETRFLSVSSQQIMGLELQALDSSFQRQNFAFLGVVPNTNINGLTAFANVDGVQTGGLVDFPDTSTVGVRFQRAWDDLRLEARSPGCHWKCVAKIPLFPQPYIRMGFGASNLLQGDRVYFHNYFASGPGVNGLTEQPLLWDLRSALRKVEFSLEGLAQQSPNWPEIQDKIQDQHIRVQEFRSSLIDAHQQNLFQPNTRVIPTLKAANGTLYLGGLAYDQSLKEKRLQTGIPLLGEIPLIGRMFAGLRGMRIQNDTELRVLLRPTLVPSQLED